MLLRTFYKISLLYFLSMPNHLWAQSFNDGRVGGTVHMSDNLKAKYHDKGVLFISVRPFGQTQGAPIAVFRIPNPKYPQAFVLGPKNAMIPGVAFQGPFTVFARHSLTGDATDAEALVASTPLDKKIEVGKRNVTLKFKD